MKQFILLFFLTFPVFIEAQPQQDKLNRMHLSLQNAADDTIRMDVLTQLGWYYYTINYDSARFYWERSLSIAQKLKLKLYEAGIISSQAFDLSWSNYPKALELFLKALKIAEDPASEKNVWNLASGRSAHEERLGTLGSIYFGMAQLYGNTGNVERQISSLLKAINLAETVQDSASGVTANLNLGNVYLDKLKKPDSALYFEQRALSLFPKSGNGSISDIGWVLGAIGGIYLEKENFDSSREALQKGLQIMQQENNLAGVGGICISLSNFYKIINKPDSSLLCANKALEAYKAFKDKLGIADAWSSISSAYGEQKRTDSAFAYLKLATALHDSLNKVERKNLLSYQNANFDEQMRVKKLEDEKLQIQTNITIYSMLAGIAVCIAIAFLLYRNNRHRKKANMLLQQQKEEIANQKNNVEQTLVELKSTQAQLIQSEKMASLGELTAGIAHEIQNPLNFVNNFSEVNKELLVEMTEEMNKGNIDNANAIAIDVIKNEEKINHHGKRADTIVKGMLQHTRATSSQKEPTDINALADEYLRLSYQGMRAKDNSFNATIQTDFDENIGKTNIVPQDIGRVLLNLYNNAFYAIAEKRKEQPGAYEPAVSVSTKKVNDTSGGYHIEIQIKDNGNGIPQKVMDKIFQPFFTTKPTGQGTGLGLSLSYDIVKAHGGEIKVYTTESEFAEFVIQLPITA